MKRIISITFLLAVFAYSTENINGYKDFQFGQLFEDVKKELSNRKIGFLTGALESKSSDVPTLLDTLEKLKGKLNPMELSKYKIRKGDTGTVDFARFSLCNSDQTKYEVLTFGYPIIDKDSIRFVIDTVNSVRYVFIQKKLRLITKLNPEKHSLKKVVGILEEKYGILNFEGNQCVYRNSNGSLSYAYNVSFKQPTGQARMIVLSDYQQNGASPVQTEQPNDIIPTGLMMGRTIVLGVSYADPQLVEETAKQWNSVIDDYLEIKREISIRKKQIESDDY